MRTQEYQRPSYNSFNTSSQAMPMLMKYNLIGICATLGLFVTSALYATLQRCDFNDLNLENCNLHDYGEFVLIHGLGPMFVSTCMSTVSLFAFLQEKMNLIKGKNDPLMPALRCAADATGCVFGAFGVFAMSRFLFSILNASMNRDFKSLAEKYDYSNCLIN